MKYFMVENRKNHRYYNIYEDANIESDKKQEDKKGNNYELQ